MEKPANGPEFEIMQAPDKPVDALIAEGGLPKKTRWGNVRTTPDGRVNSATKPFPVKGNVTTQATDMMMGLVTRLDVVFEKTSEGDQERQALLKKQVDQQEKKVIFLAYAHMFMYDCSCNLNDDLKFMIGRRTVLKKQPKRRLPWPKPS